jgi:hypothetical protein
MLQCQGAVEFLGSEARARGLAEVHSRDARRRRAAGHRALQLHSRSTTLPVPVVVLEPVAAVAVVVLLLRVAE